MRAVAHEIGGLRVRRFGRGGHAAVRVLIELQNAESMIGVGCMADRPGAAGADRSIRPPQLGESGAEQWLEADAHEARIRRTPGQRGRK